MINTYTVTNVNKLKTFNHKTNPINLKDNQAHITSEQFLNFNPPAYKHGQTSLFEYAEGRALISNSSERRSKGTAFMMIRERTPDRGSRGPAIGVTTPRPQTASHSLTSNQHFAQEKTQQCCYAPIHQFTETETHRECQCTHNLSSACLKWFKLTATDVRYKAKTNSTVLTQSS